MQFRLSSFFKLAVLSQSLYCHLAFASIVDDAEQANWHSVAVLIENQVNVNEAQADGMSALIWAAYHDDFNTVQLLLDAGANPNTASRYGITALSRAALNGSAQIVDTLLSAGADPNKEMPGGDTPLMHSARSGDAATVSILLKHDVVIDSRETWHGETALMWAAAENHPDVVRLLVEHGADINAKTNELDWTGTNAGAAGGTSALPLGGLTPLIHTARENAYEAAEVLLELGADPNLTDPVGVSPMRVALINGHLDLAHLILAKGGNPNEGALVDLMKFETSIDRRATSNRTDKITSMGLVKALLDAGAEVDSVPSAPVPKRYIWAEGGLGGRESDVTSLFIASRVGKIEFMKLFLEQGADVNRGNGRDNLSSLLIALDVGGFDPLNNTEEALIEVVSLLLEHGADINASTNLGETALHGVAQRGNDILLKYLITQGALLNIKDDSNRTPLDMAFGTPKAPGVGRPCPAGFCPRLEERESTIALLRHEMNLAGIEEEPYILPLPLEEPEEELEEELVEELEKDQENDNEQDVQI